MSQEHKLVPVIPTAEMVAAGMAVYGATARYKAMLAAAPVLIAGGYVGAFGYWCSPKFAPELGVFHREILVSTREHRDVIELIDRAHLTRLQAEVSALQHRLNTADQRVDNLESDMTEARGLVRWLYTHANVHQVGTVMMDSARLFIANRSTPERTPQDYAIEHAGYLATAADSVQEAYKAYSLAQMNVDEGGDDGEGELAELVDGARQNVHEALLDLRGMEYEFRKRSARATSNCSERLRTQDTLLPPHTMLPHPPRHTGFLQPNREVPGYTIEQMKEYGAACVEAFAKQNGDQS